MQTVAIIPFKHQSARLPLKNFQKISLKHGSPNLWQATYLVLKQKYSTKNIYWAVDETPFCKSALMSWGIFDNIYQEIKDYPKGNTLGQKLSYFIEMLRGAGQLKDVDYVLVPQVDCWPKFVEDIDHMLMNAEERPDIDYWVSARNGRQTGNWRLIKIPLTMEILGQTIGAVPGTGGLWDIATEKDLIGVQYYYRAGFPYA